MADKSSAPPFEHNETQQASRMPDAPPSYEQSIGPGGFAPSASQYPPAPSASQYPPAPGTAMYPPLPAEQKGAPPPAQGTAPTTVITQVQYVQAPNFGHRPINMVCPHCQHNITTQTDSEPGAMAWVIAAVLCVLQLYCCVCVPCCIDSLQTVTHKCPNCKKFLGRYKGNGL